MKVATIGGNRKLKIFLESLRVEGEISTMIIKPLPKLPELVCDKFGRPKKKKTWKKRFFYEK